MKVLAIAILAFTAAAHADHDPVESYRGYWPQSTAHYFQSLNAVPLASPGGDKSCQPLYKTFMGKGSLDIHYAFGYFDESSVNALAFTDPDYKISYALDGVSFDVVRNFMTLPCDPATGQQLCGFTESGDPTTNKVILTKSIEMLGSPVDVTMTLTHASASKSYADNKGPLKDLQKSMTLQSEENYFDGLKTGDVVFYNGHSRNGGGPDFNPPVLIPASLKVNYPLYEKQRVGITRLLSSLKASGRKDQIIGMFSCLTHRHFLKNFMALNPHQELILSEDEVNYLDTMMASLGYLEAILRARCGSDVTALALQTDTARAGFTSWNFLNWPTTLR